MKIYLANGLFSIGDRFVNETIASSIRKNISNVSLYVPQENDSINDKNGFADSLAIAQADSDELMSSDVLVAVIDGVEIDSGVAAEIGKFSNTGKPILALFSDVRQQGIKNLDKVNALLSDPTENQFIYRNLFVVGLIKQSNGGIFSDINSLVESLSKLESIVR